MTLTSDQAIVLKSEIERDPTAKGYAAYMADSPGTVVEFLNAPTESMIKAIRPAIALIWAATGPYANIIDVANNVSHPCRASCLVVRDALLSGIGIDLDDSDVRAMFDAWVTTNVITTAQRDDLLAKATVPASRMEVLGLPPATEQDVIGSR